MLTFLQCTYMTLAKELSGANPLVFSILKSFTQHFFSFVCKDCIVLLHT
jgi:hypothetical protein